MAEAAKIARKTGNEMGWKRSDMAARCRSLLFGFGPVVGRGPVGSWQRR